MVYFGPVPLARQYFIDMGYVPAARQTTPDFLVSVTNPLGRTMATKEHDEIRDPERRGKPIPQTALEFEEYYQNSEIKKINQADIASYKADFVGKQDLASAYKASAKAEHARHTRRQVGFPFYRFSNFTIYLQSPYTISIPMQVQIVTLRRIQIIKGNYTAQALSTTLVDGFSSTAYNLTISLN
jgi:ATP-binding cassette subfamily G (WHITE) protein 2 (SNQ2)